MRLPDQRMRQDSETGCLLWLGPTIEGLPVTHDRGRTLSARRLLWTLKRGPLGPERRIVGGCGQRACVNPYHAYQLGARQRLRQLGVSARGEEMIKRAINALPGGPGGLFERPSTIHQVAGQEGVSGEVVDLVWSSMLAQLVKRSRPVGLEPPWLRAARVRRLMSAEHGTQVATNRIR